MPVFKYRAANLEGKIDEGFLNVSDRKNLIKIIRENNFYPVEIEEVHNRDSITYLSLFTRISFKSIAIMARQLATAIKTGIPLSRAIGMQINQNENKSLTRILERVYNDIQMGHSLYSSIDQYSRWFPNFFLSLIEAGESSGTLDISMTRAADYYEREYRLSKRIKNAMIYPVTILIVSALVVYFLITRVVPGFISFYNANQGTLPLPTRILIMINSILQTIGPPMILITFAVMLLMKYVLNTFKGKLYFHKSLVYLPVIGKYVQKTACARFARGVSTLISSGIIITRAIELSARITNNVYVESLIKRMNKDLEQGVSLSTAVTKTNIFPIMMSQMILMGEETGKLDEMLDKTAQYYEIELEGDLDRVATLIEPVIILVLGTIVGYIVLSIMLPLLGMFDLML